MYHARGHTHTHTHTHTQIKGAHMQNTSSIFFPPLPSCSVLLLFLSICLLETSRTHKSHPYSKRGFLQNFSHIYARAHQLDTHKSKIIKSKKYSIKNSVKLPLPSLSLICAHTRTVVGQRGTSSGHHPDMPSVSPSLPASPEKYQKNTRKMSL